MSVLGLLVFCLSYLVDQHYLCLVAGRQVQLEVSCCFGLALGNSLQVYWCAFGNWVSSPLHKRYLPWVPSPVIPKHTVSPCSPARTGDVGSVSEQKLLKLIEKGPGNFSWYWTDPLMTGPVKHPAASEVAQLGVAVAAAWRRHSASRWCSAFQFCPHSSFLPPRLWHCLQPFLSHRCGDGVSLKLLVVWWYLGPTCWGQ